MNYKSKGIFQMANIIKKIILGIFVLISGGFIIWQGGTVDWSKLFNDALRGEASDTVEQLEEFKAPQ
jgi:hypothetical protein